MPLASPVLGFWGEDRKGEQIHQLKEEEGIPLRIINEIWLLVWPGLLCVHEHDGDDGDEVEMTSE